MRFFLIAAAVSLLSLAAMGASATDVLSMLSVDLDRPTLHALGAQVLIADDDDRDARIDVRYRDVACGVRTDGPPLLRAHPETVPSRPLDEQFAGSIFDLVPGTTYEIELHATDPDGPVDETRSISGRTRPVPRRDPSSPSIIVVNNEATLRSTLSAARPGDVISLLDGVYTGEFFTLFASSKAAAGIMRPRAKNTRSEQAPERLNLWRLSCKTKLYRFSGFSPRRSLPALRSSSP